MRTRGVRAGHRAPGARDAKEFAGFASLLAARDDARSAPRLRASLREPRSVSRSAARRRAARRTYTVLARAAPAAERPELDAGSRPRTARPRRRRRGGAAARTLVEADATWGDARLGRSRVRSMRVEMTARRPRPGADLVRGVEPGSTALADATLGWLRALRRAHDPQGACEAARGIADPAWARRRPARRDRRGPGRLLRRGSGSREAVVQQHLLDAREALPWGCAVTLLTRPTPRA